MKMDERQREKVAELRLQGMSLDGIASATGLTPSSVRYALSKLNIKASRETRQANLRASHAKKYDIDWDEVCKLVEAGRSSQDIADSMSVPRSMIERVVRVRRPTRPPNAKSRNIWSRRVQNLLDVEHVGSMDELMNKWAAINGGSHVGRYVAAHTYTSWVCSEGHEFEMIPNGVQQGKWCLKCSRAGPSKGELELLEYVTSLAADAVGSDRTAIAPTELDIFSPSLRVAFEYNGLLYHSSYFDSVGHPYDRLRHQRKALACRAAGVRLFAIFEDEWEHKRELVKAMVRWRLGKFCGKKLNARDLELRRLGKNSDFETFFARNHLDGHTSASFAYGLFDKENLVCCASVRRNFVGEMELARLATDYDFSVRGGAARLISAVIKETGILVSFSNNRLSAGGIYGSLGFVKVAENGPSYWYTDAKGKDGVKIARYRCKRVNEPEILSLYPTEKEQALGGVFSEMYLGDRRPLYQIHDYGHQKWVLAPRDS